MRTTWVRPRVLSFNPECRRREGASRRGDARRWTREPVRLRDISLPVPAPGSVGDEVGQKVACYEENLRFKVFLNLNILVARAAGAARA